MAIREMQSENRGLDRIWLRNSALASVSLSLFFGAVGPFGDYATIPLVQRLLVWALIGMAGVGLYAGSMLLFDRYRPAWSWWICLSLTGVFAAVPLTPIVLFLDALIAGDMSGGWVGGYAIVFTVGLVYLALLELLRRTRIDQTPQAYRLDATRESQTQEPCRLLKRLPRALAAPLICLKKEDHYLRVFTENGDTLIRLRMSDAVEEIGGEAGLQAHRSWWVADRAVVSAKRRSGGGAEATLSNGLEVPIARARVADAQTAGWFDR